MLTFKDFRTIIKNLAENFHFLCKYNIQKDLYRDFASKESFRKCVIETFYQLNPNLAEPFRKELDFLKNSDSLDPIPYISKNSTAPHIEYSFDKHNGLPFIIHNNKRLYFPKHWTKDSVLSCYSNYLYKENILNTSSSEHNPHQYQTENFSINQNDILLDIGCAEGILALNSIDKVSKVYLFESNPEWMPALKATFEPFKDKVSIFNKKVGHTAEKNSITLTEAIAPCDAAFFVKMDIEGAEYDTLLANESFFKNKKVKLACCTYHKYEHNEMISQKLAEWKYKISHSNGYMLFFDDGVFKPPYFRKGLIRAQNF